MPVLLLLILTPPRWATPMTTTITPTGHTATTTTTTTAPNRTAPTTAPSRTTTTTPTATTTTTNTMSAAGTAQHRTNTNFRNTCSPAHCSRLTAHGQEGTTPMHQL